MPYDRNSLESDGYNEIMQAARDAYDSGDVFAWVQEWRFAIAELLLFDFGNLVPGFRTVASEPEPESYAVESLRALYGGSNEMESLPRKHWHYEDDLKRALVMLDRYREWVRIAGRDY